MTEINCYIAYDTVSVKVRDLAGRFAPSSLRALSQVKSTAGALQAIGKALVRSTERRFETETGPHGTPWKELAPSTIERKGHDDILVDSELLYESIDFQVTSPTSLIVGSTREFAPGVTAAIHQLGGQSGRGLKTFIPARPFLGFDEADLAESERIIALYAAS